MQRKDPPPGDGLRYVGSNAFATVVVDRALEVRAISNWARDDTAERVERLPLMKQRPCVRARVNWRERVDKTARGRSSHQVGAGTSDSVQIERVAELAASRKQLR